MASQNPIQSSANDDDYYGDIFSDERVLTEIHDPDDLLTDVSVITPEIWGIHEISDEEWMDAQPGGFFMP